MRKYREDLQLRNLSPDSIRNYLLIILKLAKWFKRPLIGIRTEDLRQFAVHLKLERKLSTSYYNIACSSIRLWYEGSLQRSLPKGTLPHARAENSLPEVFSQEEVALLLDCPGQSLKTRVLLHLAYAGGLRVSEVVHLRVTDIDSRRMLLRVQRGKGAKDRYVMLSPTL